MKVAAKQFFDRLSCEFHSQIIAYFMDRDILMFPR
ncbi:MAG: LysR family hydrogen peroxide-inducible transcriptional activator, partial [bacterium]